MASQKALVVGAAGGMGSAISNSLAARGYDLALMGRNENKLNELVEACSATSTNCFSVVCDIAKTENIESEVARLIDRLGGLNVLINCAGAHGNYAAHNVDPEVADEVVDTNIKAHYHLVRHCVPEINKQSGGAVIKIGSVRACYPGSTAYLITTLGLDGFSEGLFEDVREFGTKVCTIKPGYVNTPLVESDNVNPDLMIQPEDIAHTVQYVLSMSDTACPNEITILPQKSPYT
jgi:3-oxoacyl-[acyl-carrier protein] reductase